MASPGDRLAPVPHHRAEEPEICRRQAAGGTSTQLVSGAPQSCGSSTDSIRNSACAGTSRSMRITAFSSSRLYAARRCSIVDVSSDRAVRTIDGPEDRIETASGVEARPHPARRDRPALRRLVTRHAPAPVGPQVLEEGVVAVDGARSAHGAMCALAVVERLLDDRRAVGERVRGETDDRGQAGTGGEEQAREAALQSRSTREVCGNHDDVLRRVGRGWPAATVCVRSQGSRDDEALAGQSPQRAGVWLSQDTLRCQLTKVPVGFSFHAQTCSV